MKRKGTAVTLDKWDREADVIIIGAGIAGCFAGAEARDAGAGTVLVLDKMKDVLEAPRGYTGAKGNDTAKSGGGWGALFPFPFPETATVDYVMQAGLEESRGRAFPNQCKAFWSRLNDDFFWLRDTAGIALKDRSTSLRPNSYTTVGLGPGTARFSVSYAEKKGVTILYRNKAMKLLTDSRGRVIGLKVMTPEGLRQFKAKAVVLATGGFQGNDEMKLRYLGRNITIGAYVTGSPWNTGDGHQMAMDMGAKMVNMDTVHTRWCSHVTGENPHRATGVYGIYINRHGKRYVDESSGSTETSLATAYQPESICALLIDAEIKKNDLVAKDLRRYEKSKELMKADTLEEVAKKIGVDANLLMQTVRGFNEAVNENEHKALDADPPKGKERATAYKIQVPPFYFLYPLHPGLNHSTGGPLITEHCEVVNNEDEAIPGLYAAGALAFGFMSTLYHITEMVSGLELSLTLGRVAGQSAAAYALRMNP